MIANEFEKSLLELCEVLSHFRRHRAVCAFQITPHLEFVLTKIGMSRSSQESLNEQSPLISPQAGPGGTEDNDVEGSHLSESLRYDIAALESKSPWYLFLLTLSIGGLQIVWSVELSNGSPYLLSL